MRLLLLLGVVITTTLAKDSYVVIAPSKIRPNMDLAISVNILKASGDVTVKASITQNKVEVASATSVFQAGKPGTINIKVPSNLPSSYYTLNVEGTGGLIFNKMSSVSVNKKELSLFIQTDKAIYKPGDTVNFRAFAVYSDLKPYTGDMEISINDAGANKIKQWLAAKPDNGVVTNKFILSSQPVLGDWKISVKTSKTSEQKVFTVAEYVLPKFEVDVMMPSYVLTTDKDATITVKATYTYGKPVKGSADVSVKLLYNYQKFDYSRALPVLSTNVPIDGEGKVTVPLSSVKSISQNLNKHLLIVTANVTESLTGNAMSGNGTVTMYDKNVVLEFPESNPDTFKPGLQYIAYLKVSQPDGLPVGSSTDQVKISTRVTVQLPGVTPTPYFYYNPPTQNRNLPDVLFSIPTNGLIAIPVDIPDDAKDVYINAHLQGVTKQLKLGKSHSPSDSYIQLTLKTSSSIQAGDSVSFQVKATQPLTTLVYQILSRGGIVKTGSLNANGQKDYSFSVVSDPSMAPSARIVMYYVRQDGEIVTDSIIFDVSGAFENQVSISLDKTEVEPGTKVTATVKADPGSTAHLLAIDQSVLLLKSGNDVSANDVYADLKEYDTIDSSSSNNYNFGGFGGPCLNCRRKKRMIWWPYPTFLGGSDATKIFKNAGVIVLTDALVYKYVEPIRRRFPMRRGWGGGRKFMAMSARLVPTSGFSVQKKLSPPKTESLVEPTRVRVHFPEAWLWSQSDVGFNGSASIETTVPDTITSWVASAFAVNPVSGLGVAPTQAHLKVFRPFFVSLNLPYSVTRGEHLALQAIVFNYMADDMQVRVTLARSNNFFNLYISADGSETLKQEDAVQNVLVKAGEAKSVYFPIIPADLGKIDIEIKAQSTKAADAVRRQLLVEAEGVPKEYNIPLLINLNLQDPTFGQLVDLPLPPNTVKGSEMARITAVGDLMGPSIAGLDKLLKMPTGCGEQTMLGLAPDVYITDYLKSVNQLTGDIESKALGFMESGYQRELTYKHDDGSFSAFGKNDDSGSMWLTAFVCRVFHQAKSHIFIDDEILYKAINWMINKQNADGSFPEPGRVIHKNMQGQSGSGTALTLFVFISLLENKDVLSNTNAAGVLFEGARQKALTYLETEVEKSNDLYVLAMASYAFQLAGSSKTQSVLDKLESKATFQDGQRYWHKPEAPKTTTGGWHRPNPTKAVDIEMTSYVLLTYAARSDVINAKNIMQWIVKQRNSNGGFSSTQDTCVALNALSEFARQTYGDSFNVKVTAQTDTNTKYTFNINSNNALVLQSRELENVPQNVLINATGSGMALVDIAVFFNVESEIEETTFDLTVKLVEETLNHLVVETCTKWRGEGQSSAMAVQEIGIPSGFSADLESLPQLDTLKRVETQDKKIILYFDYITTTDVCLTFRAERTGLVAKSQAAAVRVYDYYEPGNQITGFYQSQLLKDASVCQVCKECENCV